MGENLAVRTQFTAELIALTKDLTLMCTLAHDAVERVTDALVDADLTATYEVFALDEQLQKMYGACEARTVVLLALQAPVARDLRHVVTAIQIAGELSRIGWLASRVADQVYQRHPGPVARQPMLDILAAMGKLAAERTALAGWAVAGHQPLSAETPTDPSMETLHQQLHSALRDPTSQPSTDMAIDNALLGHHLERCVDHTARIDRLIRFLDTGVPPTAQPNDDE
ncbi:phosphate uptake regulator, PhoU [Nocardia sp. NBC_00508]|uniref:phosphate signaling complex PhoU family protein n=1 Tax=Nocardia sp. NBC_00508 TaxID=2975992 RepID=UPI002E809684|nr:PhoU domain-containing protein [Nocardia sp. NBC_00508]WUD68307.1 phosphate uptake regulator, PhoU [Nocardia sp. NBC_00508]